MLWTIKRAGGCYNSCKFKADSPSHLLFISFPPEVSLHSGVFITLISHVKCSTLQFSGFSVAWLHSFPWNQFPQHNYGLAQFNCFPCNSKSISILCSCLPWKTLTCTVVTTELNSFPCKLKRKKNKSLTFSNLFRTFISRKKKHVFNKKL